MNAPLASTGEGFHFGWVKPVLISVCLAVALGQHALAQVDPADELPPPDVPSDFIDPNLPPEVSPEVRPETPQPTPEPFDAPDIDIEVDIPPLPDAEAIEAPDYSRLSSNAERTARLDDMFARLKDAEDAQAAKLVAEEIWAVWTRSGSASVDFVLRRAAAAQSSGRTAMARALFDTVTELQPDFAEGWARSARLALDEKDYSRAIGDSIRALQIEPRHYYALWTMASVLERLGRNEDALEAYREAQSLYPELEQVSERVRVLESQLDGGVL